MFGSWGHTDRFCIVAKGNVGRQGVGTYGLAGRGRVIAASTSGGVRQIKLKRLRQIAETSQMASDATWPHGLAPRGSRNT